MALSQEAKDRANIQSMFDILKSQTEFAELSGLVFRAPRRHRGPVGFVFRVSRKDEESARVVIEFNRKVLKQSNFMEIFTRALAEAHRMRAGSTHARRVVQA